MPSRTIPLVNNEYYHVFNRGVARMPIFNSNRDYKHFLQTMLYYQVQGPKPRFSLYSSNHNIDFNNKIVQIASFCLMPNHFHFLVQQVKDHGIREFVSNLTNSYGRYFNTKYKRVGPLFQGKFKAVYIESNEQLIHLSRYIHLNPLIGNIIKKLDEYQWSSYLEYINLSTTSICSKGIILDQFPNSTYENFVRNHEDYARSLDYIRHQLLESSEV